MSEADRATLRAKYPDAILLSAKSPEDVAALRETIIAFFEATMVDDQFVLPYAKQGLLGDVYANARVLSEAYDSTGRDHCRSCQASFAAAAAYLVCRRDLELPAARIMRVRGLPGAIARLRRTFAAS